MFHRLVSVTSVPAEDGLTLLKKLQVFLLEQGMVPTAFTHQSLSQILLYRDTSNLNPSDIKPLTVVDYWGQSLGDFLHCIFFGWIYF